MISTVCVLILTVLGWHMGIFTNQEKMNLFLTSCGVFAPLFFMLIQAIQVTIPILPGAVGCLYGVVFWGTSEKIHF